MRLLNYFFWGIGYLYLILIISLWWILASPIVILLFHICDDWIDRMQSKLSDRSKALKTCTIVDGSITGIKDNQEAYQHIKKLQGQIRELEIANKMYREDLKIKEAESGRETAS